MPRLSLISTLSSMHGDSLVHFPPNMTEKASAISLIWFSMPNSALTFSSSLNR